MKTILFLSANPIDSHRLRLDEEIREIEESLRRSKYHDHFSLIPKWAVRPHDIHRALLDSECHIIHFSGHGSLGSGIYLEDDTRQSYLVDSDSISELFSLIEKIECVFLNCCYSESQARAIAQYVDVVIGTPKLLEDKNAIKFAQSFYDAIGAGKSYQVAYSIGCNRLKMERCLSEQMPIIISYTNIKARVLLVEDKDIAVRLIKSDLMRLGYEVFVANNYPEAISLMGEMQPNLILLDVMLPGDDNIERPYGIELCKYAHTAFSNVKIVLMTASHSTDPEQEAIIKQCADEYIVKSRTHRKEILEKLLEICPPIISEFLP